MPISTILLQIALASGLIQPARDVLVRVETGLGNIDIAVDTAHAPITAANFLKYVDGGFYNAGRFHRATRPDNYVPQLPDRPQFQIIQADINPDRRDKFPPIPLERTTKTGLTHRLGTISMPRGENADSATSGFVICLDEATPSLDFGSKRYPDGQGFAAFGRVVRGMDVVRRIHRQPVKGQALDPPVTITRIYRIQEHE